MRSGDRSRLALATAIILVRRRSWPGCDARRRTARRRPKSGHLSRRHDPRRHAADLPRAACATAAVPSSKTARFIVGKVARLTLLPGHAIPFAGVSNRKVVANGAEVKLVYAEGGLLIVTTGAALQDGSIGDVVRVRNSDSGVTVSGAVQPDGSVKVGGG